MVWLVARSSSCTGRREAQVGRATEGSRARILPGDGDLDVSQALAWRIGDDGPRAGIDATCRAELGERIQRVVVCAGGEIGRVRRRIERAQLLDLVVDERRCDSGGAAREVAAHRTD